MTSALPNTQPPALLSTEPATRREMRLAVVALLVSLLVFVAAAPFAKRPVEAFPAFVPIYVSWLVICDLITAALLFGQFNVSRSTALLVLSGAYLFSAMSTFAYALIFPGLVPLPAWVPTGPQTSSAMYMFWHAGFPLMLIVYTRFRSPTLARPDPEGDRGRGPARLPILGTIGGLLALVLAFSAFASWGNEQLPVFLQGNRTSDLGRTVLGGIWVLTAVALASLWRIRTPTMLDLWLQVVMCVWLCDIALAAILNGGRYDLGWYAGRLYGMVAASYLLIVLLAENTRQYVRLAQVSQALHLANAALAQQSRHDGLTAIANRRYFDEALFEQMALARRHHRPLALVLLDVDHFKAYNDGYGHLAGDECLKRVAAVLDACCHRPVDMAARYGGEEFAMLLPETELTGAVQLAESARLAILALQMPHANSPSGPHVSVSAGVAMLGPDMQAQGLIEAADQSLYRAKAAGRNRVVAAAGSAAAANGQPAQPIGGLASLQ